MIADAAIEVDSVSKEFRIPSVRRDTVREHALDLFRRRSVERLTVLQDVSLTIRRGESVALMGRNGSGKSTLLKIVAGIFPADRGKVTVSGGLTPILELGVGFNAELDAIDNIYLLGTVMGLTLAEIGDRLDEILEFAELERFARLKLQHFSSGMIARLAYAVAFNAVSETLLLDEIFAVGDAAFRTRCEERYKELVDAGHTVMLVSHDPYMVAELCERAILIEGGRVLLDGPAPRVAEAYLKMLAGADALSVAYEARMAKQPAPAVPAVRLRPASVRGRSRLACPACHYGIDVRPDAASCARCGYTRSQSGLPYMDLRLSSGDDEQWARRQSLMEHWYAALIADPVETRRSFEYDYGDLAPWLADIEGAVVDVGGGLGLGRHYATAATSYVIVEPSTFWLEKDWASLAGDFAMIAEPVEFVRGHGEALPLRDGSFDAVLALWSLNHAADPARVVEEIGRVLRPGGRFIAVLEDMVPTSADVARAPHLGALAGAGEVQEDHVPIREADFLRLLDGRFQVRQRSWIRHYLAFDLCRVANSDDCETTAPPPSLERWRNGLQFEAEWWRQWFATGGLEWPADYHDRLDPTRPIQPRVAARIPARGPVSILDVGSGPLSRVGYTRDGRDVTVTGVDPLAEHYRQLLASHGLDPAFAPLAGEGERLVDLFGRDRFDIVNIENALGHTLEPLLVIDQMLAVVKPRGRVLLLDEENEADATGYLGLHQWNAALEDRRFILWNRDRRVDVTARLAGRADVRIAYVDEPHYRKALSVEIVKITS